jgi:hypothetical protein
MLTVLGLNVKLPPGPTATSTVVLVADGTPFKSGWPFSSKIVIGAAASSLCGLVLARLSPDSARTKNTIPKMIAVQKINRAAFNLFIRVTPFMRARGFIHEYPTARLRTAIQRQQYAQEVRKRQAE